MDLPQNYRRVADSFDGLDQAGRERVIGHLQAARPEDRQALVDQMLRNGGPEAELVARIFNRQIDTVNPQAGSLRTVDNKKATPAQKKDGGSGAIHHMPEEEPHTSTANPPVPGHATTQQTKEQREQERQRQEKADITRQQVEREGE